MLYNFCLHVYAQKSLFIAENCNVFFDTSITLSCEFRSHRAGSQLKIREEKIYNMHPVIKGNNYYLPVDQVVHTGDRQHDDILVEDTCAKNQWVQTTATAICNMQNISSNFKN